MPYWINPDDDVIRQLLAEARTIAVVGLSNDTGRSSYSIARYLQQVGYRIIPVNPTVDEVLGEQAYPDLLSVPESIDVVNIFRRSQYVPPHVDEAINRGDVKLIWMQVGVQHEAAARRAQEAGITVVMNRCLAVEHRLHMRQRA